MTSIDFSSDIANSKARLVSLMTPEPFETVDEREEFDIALDNLEVDLTYISDAVHSDKDLVPAAIDLVDTFKGFNLGSMTKDLEIGIAYASR